MSSKYQQSLFSKTTPDPLRLIKPILQSRKKAEQKPPDLKPISTASKAKQSPVPKQTLNKVQESSPVSFKEQRTQRLRKSDSQKSEKTSLKEVEKKKIQNSARKNSVSELAADVKETNKLILSNSRTPSLSEQFSFIELFKPDPVDSDSIKDRICRQFLQKYDEKKPEINEEIKQSLSEDLNLSFEDPNLFMPEIPFFQYNYTNYDVIEPEFPGFYRETEELPYPGTVSILYDLNLWTGTGHLIRTETFELGLVSLPTVDPVFINEPCKIRTKIRSFQQESFKFPNNETKILKSLSFHYTKKPVCGLLFEEKTVQIISKFQAWAEGKQLVGSLEIRKKTRKLKKISYFEYSFFKAAISSKPLIVLQENKNHRKTNEISQENVVNIGRISVSANPGLLISASQKSNFSVLKMPSFEIPKTDYFLDSPYKTSVFPNPDPAVQPAVQVISAKFKLNQEKLRPVEKLQNLRKIETSLYVIFSLKRQLTIFNFFKYWKNSKKTRPFMPDRKTIQKFVNYSAAFIQRNWKGFYVRKHIIPNLLKYQRFKYLLKSLLISWKTRKILSTRRMQGHFKSIKDLKAMINDLKIERSSDILLPKMIEELPKIHSKMIKDFNTLFRTGTWVALLNRPPVNNTPNSKYLNRDEEPVKPLLTSYEDQSSELGSNQPKKVFSNFLKRKTKTWTVEKGEKTVNATEESKETTDRPAKTREKQARELQEIEEEFMQEEKKPETKPKEFLKRKSQSIKSKKLQWKVQRKIDCWVSKDLYSNKKPGKQERVQREFFTVEELEGIFEESLQSFVDTSSYLKKFERVAAKTRVPQFKSSSDYLFEVKEENYYEVLEDLESHYLVLCTQGIRM